MFLLMFDLQSDEDSSLVEELRFQLAQKERELQMMKEGAEELNSLSQQNYLLQSKVHKQTQHRNLQNKNIDSIPCSHICCKNLLLTFRFCLFTTQFVI